MHKDIETAIRARRWMEAGKWPSAQKGNGGSMADGIAKLEDEWREELAKSTLPWRHHAIAAISEHGPCAPYFGFVEWMNQAVEDRYKELRGLWDDADVFARVDLHALVTDVYESGGGKCV